MSCIMEILQRIGPRVAIVRKNCLAVEGGGLYRGYEWLITFNDMGHRCGYVAVPPGHPFYENDWSADCEVLSVHGGVTFHGSHGLVKEYLGHSCEDRWIGFDAGHHGDLPDAEKVMVYFPELEQPIKDHILEMGRIVDRIFADEPSHHAVRDFSYMESECRFLIDQLIEKTEKAA